MNEGMIRVTTGRDFGCPMGDVDVASYVALVERRLEEIYGVPSSLVIEPIGNTRCIDCPAEVDPTEVARLVGVELWNEWCAS